MSNRPHGKYVNIDQDFPTAVGICDYSGLVVSRRDMVKQMEWRGNRLIWTGLLVNKRFADVPNPQLKPPLLKPDPYPVRMPRPPVHSFIEWQLIQEPYWQFISDIYPTTIGPHPEVITSRPNPPTTNWSGNFYGANDLAYVWNNWGAVRNDGVEAPGTQFRYQPLATAYFGV